MMFQCKTNAVNGMSMTKHQVETILDSTHTCTGCSKNHHITHCNISKTEQCVNNFPKFWQHFNHVSVRITILLILATASVFIKLAQTQTETR